jgi:predicted nucleotidyltransferase
MKKNLIYISNKIDKDTVDILESINGVTDELQLPYFVVGAKARDMIFELHFGLSIIRATQDIDISIHIPDWDQYEKLIKALIATGEFRSSGEPQRIFHNHTTIVIDIIPFGPIADNLNQVTLPPEHVMKLSVLGFEEAYENTYDVKIRSEPEVVVKVVNLPGLALLKLIAWEDRKNISNKDAKDLKYIIENYLDAGNEERFQYEHAVILISVDYDYTQAGAKLLGLDLGMILSESTRDQVLIILEKETDESETLLLAIQMTDPISDDLDSNLNLLRSFKEGVLLST